MKHESDNWIASQWMGLTVRQFQGATVGRVAKVVETLWDEKGALHLRTDDGRWCPAVNLLPLKSGKCPCCGEPLQDDVCQNTECG